MGDVRSGGHNERREYFRIGDEIFLDYRVLPEDEYRVLREQSLEHRGKTADLPLQLHALTAQGSNILAAIRKTQPDIAQYLALLEKKVELLTRAVAGSQEELQVTPNSPVNLSGGGLSFHSATALAVKVPLELRLILFPHHLFIHCLGEVVHCETVSGVPGKPYHLGIDFTHISEMARDAIVRHTLELQSAQLRRAREREQG